mmetsp:Transcript_2223/g.5078  ORF Transcript_2223/g.5078 Transcript_2223/m.5078 type:complete len:926 (+) Transcript_2223:36-2813(+)
MPVSSRPFAGPSSSVSDTNNRISWSPWNDKKSIRSFFLISVTYAVWSIRSTHRRILHTILLQPQLQQEVVAALGVSPLPSSKSGLLSNSDLWAGGCSPSGAGEDTSTTINSSSSSSSRGIATLDDHERSPSPSSLLLDLQRSSPVSILGDNKRLVSVLVPEYKGSSTIGRLLKDIKQQTYRPLEIIVSLDESDEVHKSEAVVQQFIQEQESSNSSGLVIHLLSPSTPTTTRQRKSYNKRKTGLRLHWVQNVNTLLSKSTGKYVTVVPHDDSIPPRYIEKLAECLDDDPQAVNCFPQIRVIRQNKTANTTDTGHSEKEREQEPEYIVQETIEGPQYTRVDEAITHCCGVSFRGLVRRPAHGSMRPFFLPRLHKNFYMSDVVQLLYHATAGHVRNVSNVTYDKYYHMESVHNKMMRNRTSFSIKDWDSASLDFYTSMYNSAHSYSSSSRNTYDVVLQKFVMLLRHGRILDDSQNMTANDDEMEPEWERLFHRRIRKTKRVAILGAGIQGCVMALMFRKNGYDVTIYDKSDDIMNRASTAGEGKIHLGLVYSKDLTMRTGRHMLQSALRFSPYLDYLVGDKVVDWENLKSEPFTYLIPFSSLVNPEEFEGYATNLENIYETILSEDTDLSYLGLRPPTLIERRQEQLHPMVNRSFFQAEYKSTEYAIDTSQLKAILKDALVNNSIKMVFGRNVETVEQNRRNTNTTGIDEQLGRMKVVTNVSEHDFDVVVNCMWEGRSKIDRRLGVDFPSGNNYRFKTFIRFPFTDEYEILPSITVVNGEYGDFVQYSPDSDMYFSYYPVARLGITTNETEMVRWDDLADGRFPSDLRTQQVDAHQQAFKMFFSGFPYGGDAFKTPLKVGGGYILGNGDTDILDESTLLHERNDFPFVIMDDDDSDGSYISVSTQKLTSAPYNAYLLERKLFRKDAFV